MSILFFIVALMVIAAAVGVVANTNPLHSALCLIVNLLGVAVLFAMLDAHFLAAVQVIVYAGAIVVLVLFVLMLLNLKVENPARMGRFYSFVAIVTGLTFVALLLPVFNEAFSVFREPVVTVDTPAVAGTVKAVGELLYQKYVYTFEVTAVLLLAAIAGAVMLAKRAYRSE